MNADKLQEAIAATAELTESVLGTLVADRNDPRLVCLRLLVQNLRPAVPGITGCSACKLSRGDMAWHPSEDMNLCPRCGSALVKF